MELGEEGEGVGRGGREKEKHLNQSVCSVPSCFQFAVVIWHSFLNIIFFAVNHQIESDMINTAFIHPTIY